MNNWTNLVRHRRILVVLFLCASGFLLLGISDPVRAVQVSLMRREALKCLTDKTTEACRRSGTWASRLLEDNNADAKTYYFAALLRSHASDEDLALRYALNAAALEPRESILWSLVAKMNYQVGDSTSGADALWRAMELSCGSSNAPCFVELGRTYMYRLPSSDPSSALRAYWRAVALGTSAPELWSLIALGYNAEGRSDLAIATLDEHKVVFWLADTARGDAYNSFGWRDEALAAFRNAIAQSPNETWVWQKLALTYMGKGDYDDARKALLRALEISPGYVPAIQALSRIEAGSAQ